MVSFTSKTSCDNFLIRYDDKVYIDNCYLAGADIQVATNKDLENLKKFFISKGFRKE